MKLLTLMTFVTAPLTLLAGLFGMNLKHLPFIDDQNGFWFIIGCMLVISAGFLVFFKRKGWL
jgi:magnesium transporter